MLNSLILVSILRSSIRVPPKRISVIGGELIKPRIFRMIDRTAKPIKPQAIMPSILSRVFILSLLIIP